MSLSEGIYTTQQLANAAEAFVSALDKLFPETLFEQFFHPDTIRSAYWRALEEALDGYATPERTALVNELMTGQVLATPRVVGELLKLFRPGDGPDYAIVTDAWRGVLPDGARAGTPDEARALFGAIAGALRRSPDLHLVLQQLGRATYSAPSTILVALDEDLNRLLDAAVLAGPGAVSRQIRHLLALGAEHRALPPEDVATMLLALANVAAYLPPGAIRLIWERVLRLDDPALRIQVIARLAPYVHSSAYTPDLLALVEDAIARSVPPIAPVDRVDALLTLAPYLAATQDQTMAGLQQRALDGARAIGDPASRVRALAALIEKLPAELQREAVALAFDTASNDISNELARATALSDLPPHLPPDSQARLLNMAYQIESPEACALLLGRMIPFLPGGLQRQALAGALRAIEQISGDDARARSLIALAPSIDAVGLLQDFPDGLQQAITVIFSIDREDARAQAFAALAPYLSPELLSEALEAVKSIADDADREVTLSRLAPHLPAELNIATIAVAHELGSSDARAAALLAIAPYLSAAARAQVLAEALAAALAIERWYDRVVALTDLAPHLPDDLQRRALQEAMIAARSLRDEDERRRALIVLVPHLPDDLLADALADAYTLLDPLQRVPVLGALLSRLPAEPSLNVAQEVLDTARNITAAADKATLLATMAPVLPDELLPLATAVARSVDTPYERMHVLTALLPRDPGGLHDDALAAARAVPDQSQRANALQELVAHTSFPARQQILEEALAAALDVSDEYDRASALASLAPYIDTYADTQDRQRDALELALNACLEVTSPRERALLLGRLAQQWSHLLTTTGSYSLWRRLMTFLRKEPYAERVTDLAALAPIVEQMGAASATEDIAYMLLQLMVEG
jgi:hypothetical protein